MSETQVKVRFCETDLLGHINNTSYFIYLEEARGNFLDLFDYKRNLDKQFFIVASVRCDFIHQGYFKQVFTIKTYISRIGTKSIELKHEIICSETREVIAKGSDVLVYFDSDEQNSIPIPNALKELFSKHMVS
ncbi:acyl-CoA thioesterase [Peribacillus frigoritolerans]|uniref:acyl-CoA thioesterase n=1 Tax=Peribacillus frigoritolerans TaxID=450367 RepID=UPI0021D2450E|nr:thioesterase family protein [Peribacillus frigoritolerans]MCU6598963.1 acyl-CoA thioesterase [Peribacillus frigoritolerans]